MIHYVSDLIVPYLISGLSLSYFLLLGCMFVFGLIYILEVVRQRSREIRKKDSLLNLIHKSIIIAEYSLLGIVMILLLQIFLMSQYSIYLLVATTAIVQTLTVSILALFAFKFFLWLKLNRNSIVVLLYGLSFAIFALSVSIIAALELSLFPFKDQVITAQSKVVYPYDYMVPGSIIDNLWSTYVYLEIIFFSSLLSGTAILLRHYLRKIGRLRFWILVLLPLAYYLSTTIENLDLYVPATDTEWFYWYLYVSLNSTAGGILFAFAFISIARTMREDSPVRQYLIIAAYGFVLQFIASQVTLIGASYPPYGMMTMSFLPLSSYMIFLGVYSTAVSISQDNQLRRSVRKIATQDSNLLSSIGTAQMEREIQRTVNSMKNVVAEQEKELKEQTGIEANLEEDEMKNYLEEVMQEVGKAKKPST